MARGRSTLRPDMSHSTLRRKTSQPANTWPHLAGSRRVDWLRKATGFSITTVPLVSSRSRTGRARPFSSANAREILQMQLGSARLYLPVGNFCTNPSWPTTQCSSTCMLVLGWPAPPNSQDAGAGYFFSQHPGGCHFLFGDGAAKLLKQTIDPTVMMSLSSRSGGELVNADQL